MKNLNTTNPKWTFKDIISKKTGKILLIAGISVLVIWNIYYFGYKKLIDNSYQKGVLAGTEAGKNEINTMIMQQLQQLGGIRINVPNEKGEIQTIFLVPEINNITITPK